MKNKVLAIIMIITFFSVGVTTNAGVGKMKKITNPILPKAGDSYLLDRGDIYIKAYSKKKNSVIYYTTNGKKPNKKSKKYTNPILFKVKRQGFTLKAINTKKGYKNSKVVKKIYKQIFPAPPKPMDGIECETIKAGDEELMGTFKPVGSEFTYYVYADIKEKNKTIKRYKTEVKNGEWKIKLGTPIKNGLTVVISASTKEMKVNFSKGDKKNEVIVSIYVPIWKRIEQKVE